MHVCAVLDLAEEEVGQIRTTECEASPWHAAVFDPVVPGELTIRQPGWSGDGPVESAGHHDALHLGGVPRDITQQGAAQHRGEDAVLEEHGGRDHQQPAQAHGLHGRHDAARAIAEDRRPARSRRAERGEDRIVTGKGIAELGDAARVALPHDHTLPRRAQLLRRSHESRDSVTSFNGLTEQRSAGAAGGTQNKESHADTR